MHLDAFQIEGIVIGASPNGTWGVELSNGHRLLAFLSARLRRDGVSLMLGEKVILEMSPFDMSKGRIIGKAEN